MNHHFNGSGQGRGAVKAGQGMWVVKALLEKQCGRRQGWERRGA